jgi:hypothetical protein
MIVFVACENNIVRPQKCGNLKLDHGEVCDPSFGIQIDCRYLDFRFKKDGTVCKYDCSGWDASLCDYE